VIPINRVAHYFPITEPKEEDTPMMTDTTTDRAPRLTTPTRKGLRPLHRSAQTFAMGDDLVTLETIIVHRGGGLGVDSPILAQWEDLPESGQAGWEQSDGGGEFEIYTRIIEG